MAMLLKLKFVCETGSQCRSMGRDFKWEEVSVSIIPTAEGFFGALKRALPSGWKRDAHELLLCDLCAAGRIAL
jgi:hypothetical protein